MAKEARPSQESAAAAEPQAAPAVAGAAQAPVIDFVDLPELAETYADSIHSIFFDGVSLRINFAVTRLGEIKQNQQPTGKRYPCVRLVLSAGAAVDLMNQMRQVSAALTQAGILKAATPGQAQAQTATPKTN